MKKLFYFAVALLMSSCSYQFLQVGKLSSDNVVLSDKGDYEYKHSEFTISYNFWSYGGSVAFTITNNSDKDIYLLMDKCFFVQNGVAYDYYQNRTFTSKTSSSYTSSISATASSTNVQYNNILFTTYGNSVSKSATGVVVGGVQSGYSIAKPENKEVCIPAHSSKYFSEFYISDIPYRQCGFARDTNDKEGEKIHFPSAAESPQSIENRLVFNINGEIVPIVNTFYVCEYMNIGNYENYAFISHLTKDCKGNNIYPLTRSYIHKANNSFYTKYECKFGKDNDRTK